jgi:hypothetical protein
MTGSAPMLLSSKRLTEGNTEQDECESRVGPGRFALVDQTP